MSLKIDDEQQGEVGRGQKSSHLRDTHQSQREFDQRTSFQAHFRVNNKVTSSLFFQYREAGSFRINNA